MDVESNESALLEKNKNGHDEKEINTSEKNESLHCQSINNASQLIKTGDDNSDIVNIDSTHAKSKNSVTNDDVKEASPDAEIVKSKEMFSSEVKSLVDSTEDQNQILKKNDSTAENIIRELLNDSNTESEERQDCDSCIIINVPVASKTHDVTMDDLNVTSKDSQNYKDKDVNATLKEKRNESIEVEVITENDTTSTSMNENINCKNFGDSFFIDKRTPLEVIAMQYDSSDEEHNNEDDKEKSNVSNAQAYRNKDTVELSSDSSSNSESDSSSSSSSSSKSDLEKCNSDNSENSEDESSKQKKIQNRNSRVKKNTQSQGEYDDLPPIEDLQISVPEVLCDPLGKVDWFAKEMVVVTPQPGKPTLNLDTVLFIEKGQRALGHIFDVFGQVSQPHYCVRFNSSDHIQERDIKVGMTVYFCPNTPYTSLVFLSELQKMKAVDDLEDDDPPQFSDDEEEQAYLASLKKKNSNKSTVNQPKPTGQSETPIKRHRGNKNQGWQSNHPWNSYRENQQLQQQLATRPFYRSHHPWSRPRYPQTNNWPWYQPQQPLIQQQLPQFMQQANWASAYGPQAFGYPGPQQQVAAYQPVEQSYGQVQQHAAAYNANNYGQVQQQQQQSEQDFSRLVSQYHLLTPPPPPPPPSDQSK